VYRHSGLEYFYFKGKGKKNKEPESELKQYMDQMDRELAGTPMGQSFEKVSNNKLKGKVKYLYFVY
jgi:hypothetical protein